MKILCAFDSFKGCLSSEQAGEAARRGLLRAFPGADVSVFVCADGGEGMAEAVCSSGIGERVAAMAADPLMRPVLCGYTFDKENGCAYIDLAEASGITRLFDAEKTPMKSTTFGTGELIMDAIGRGVKEIYLGLGGSATNDCGLGALQAMGVEFYDADGLISEPITGGNMDRIESIVLSGLPKGISYRLLCDVADDWYDALRYAPQKGADAADLVILRQNLEHVEALIGKYGLVGCRGKSTGAAGASAGGFRAFLNAEIIPGAREILAVNGFAAAASRRPAMILTGEGCSDSQTLMGKLPAEVLAMAPAEVPVILLSGRMENAKTLKDRGFADVMSINDVPSARCSDKDPLNSAVAERRLEEAAAIVATRLL